MNATTIEATSATSLCFTPCATPAKRRDTPEVELIRRLKAGDEMAFCELVERYESKIHSVTYGILRNHDDADEIAQEVFAKVYFSIKGFDERSSLYTWIYRIAVNECYGYLRKKRGDQRDRHQAQYDEIGQGWRSKNFSDGQFNRF